MPNLLTTKQAAELRGVERNTINDWIHNKENPLPAHKPGRDWFINETDLLKYQPNKPGNPHKTKR